MRFILAAALAAFVTTSVFASSGDGCNSQCSANHSGVGVTASQRDALANEAGNYVATSSRKNAERFVKEIAGDKNFDNLGIARTNEALYAISQGRRANAGNLVDTYTNRAKHSQTLGRISRALSARGVSGGAASFDGFGATCHCNGSSTSSGGGGSFYNDYK